MTMVRPTALDLGMNALISAIVCEFESVDHRIGVLREMVRKRRETCDTVIEKSLAFGSSQNER